MNAAAQPAAAEAESALLDAFCDTLWLEHGLSRNTLAGYRSDLAQFALWLAPRRVELAAVTPVELAAYLRDFSVRAKATSQRRLLSALRRFYRYLLADGRIAADPTLNIEPPAPAERFPKTLSEAQVEALLAAPDVDTALGLRDRAMLEVLYACGLRVSELVGLKLFELSLDMGVVRVFGKGSKERLVPLGQVAQEWVERYLRQARPEPLPTAPPGHCRCRSIASGGSCPAQHLATPCACRRRPPSRWSSSSACPCSTSSSVARAGHSARPRRPA